MRRSGHSDLPLHYGRVPRWLAERMASLSGSIVESIIQEYGVHTFLSKMSDPFWFQSLGAVLGMDWHSSGITTSVLGALKKSVNPHSKEFGLTICGGRGKHARNTPAELNKIGDRVGFNANTLIHASRLAAKVDNTAVQDGFQIYLHSFIVADSGEWTIVQQGMNGDAKQARRYHWHSQHVQSFIKEPHNAVCGENQGKILNLVHQEASLTHQAMLDICEEKPLSIINEARSIKMPDHHDVRAKDVNLKRLGAILTLAHDHDVTDFESLLLLEGVGPRTIQSLALVSEVIHGTPSRFDDPARFSFAHGGKDGHPFPVPLKVYDETIEILNHSVQRAKLDRSDKVHALKSLHKLAQKMEKNFHPDPAKFNAYIEHERKMSPQYGGRTVADDKKVETQKNSQLSLFD